ncbi:MAG: fatty acid desaturase [Cyanobacteria bacterium J06639_16]
MDGLIPQRVYAKQLRSQLPPTAFNPDPSKLILLLINLLILLLGWGIGAQLNHWPKQWLWLYVPFAVVMANSVIVMAFASHDLMHGSVIRNYKLAYKISLVSQAILWMPPTLWKIIHNQIHHNKTNTPEDPDRNYQYQQPDTIGKRVQNLFFPSSEVSLVWLILGMMIQWSVYAFRNILLALVENSSRQNYAPATFTVSNRERWKIVQEFALMLGMHFGVLAWLSFDPLKLALAYVLPIVLGHAGMMFYIYTNHLVSPMTDVNDPLVNSVSALANQLR